LIAAESTQWKPDIDRLMVSYTFQSF